MSERLPIPAFVAACVSVPVVSCVATSLLAPGAWLLLAATVTVGLTYSITCGIVPEVYVVAGFDYSHGQVGDTLGQIVAFDNTAGTWATDYVLAFALLFGLATRTARRPRTRLNTLVALLALLYAASVLVGGFCHQCLRPGSPLFRVLWSVCTGTVVAAAAVIGAVGSLFAEQGASAQPVQGVQKWLSHPLPAWIWPIWAVTAVGLTVAGCLSMRRPAADIFAAGVTQTIPTFYLEGVLLAVTLADMPTRTLWQMRIGFILNAPLILLYPLALISTDLSLGSINAALHVNLGLSWGLQWYALDCYDQILSERAGCVSDPLPTDQQRLHPTNPVRRGGKREQQ